VPDITASPLARIVTGVFEVFAAKVNVTPAGTLNVVKSNSPVGNASPEEAPPGSVIVVRTAPVEL
jgi:hypothetical protein